MRTVFSGVQPTSQLTLGNYLGAIQYFVSLQGQVDRAIYCVVDLHAITVPHDPKELRENISQIAAAYLAAGIDPSRAIIFAQSDVPEHPELAWILGSVATMGELSRQTQFKEKGEGQTSVSVGLFTYPILMAADILLYDTTEVPVGDDQKQHVELTRDLAQRFNSRYGETFTLPKPVIPEVGARIMALDDPMSKMSKSSESGVGTIYLTDSDEAIRTKVGRAVTDSGAEIRAGVEKPALTNLLTIFSLVSNKDIPALEREYEHQNYAKFKEDLALAIIAKIGPIRDEMARYSSEEIDRVLFDGAERAREMATPKLFEVKQKLGLWR